MRLSICIIAYNEETHLPSLLENIQQQEYDHSLTEIVLVDGNSEDRTKSIMEEFARQNKEFYNVQVLDNPKRIQAAGWNIAITHASGDVISRIDAHTMVPKEFSRLVMEDIQSGETVVGGLRPCIIENDTSWGRTLLAAENSMFGSSVNTSRRSLHKQYVKTMFHASYRKEVFETVGLFNEQLLRTEDNEMHYRIRQAGYRLLYDPRIVSYQYARSTFLQMLHQKYQNGVWIGRTCYVCPRCLSLYHFIPAAFVCGVVITTILALIGIWQMAAFMWGLYGLFAILNMFISMQRRSSRASWLFALMPVLFVLLHVSYGAGTIWGLIKKS